MFTQAAIDDVHAPKPGLTMGDLIAMRAAEPVELDHLRRADHNRRKKAAFAARQSRLEMMKAAQIAARKYVGELQAEYLKSLQKGEIGHPAPKSDK